MTISNSYFEGFKRMGWTIQTTEDYEIERTNGNRR